MAQPGRESRLSPWVTLLGIKLLGIFILPLYAPADTCMCTRVCVTQKSL